MLLNGLTLAEHGAQLFPAAIRAQLKDLLALLETLPSDQAGIRINAMPALQPYLAPDGPIGVIASQCLGRSAMAVRTILFDKTAETNWSLAWHQDRTICVQERVEVEGFGPWSIKAGQHHVAPPFDLLSRMVTLRVHLDDVPATNAPLLIALGSHKLGQVPANKADAIAARCGTVTCLASAGDVWAYATPILHASEAAKLPLRRRVLQIDYSADSLPGGLAWLKG